MGRHIQKYTHNDGEKLIQPILWCGAKDDFSFTFTDAQHAALSLEQGSRIEPCKKCTNAIIKQLSKA